MMTDDADIRIDFQAEAGSDALSIARCWLPMQLFSGVQVTVESKQVMTLFERFAVEALLKLGSVTTDDLMEIASIPPELGRWLLSSLVQKRLAMRGDRGYIPVVECCEEALEQSSLPVSRNEQRDCLWFPETNEVVVLRDGGPIQRGIRHLRCAGRYPLQGDIASIPRTDLLRLSLSAGLVHGDAGAVITELTATGETDASCPAYMARVMLSPPGEAEDWSVTLIGGKKGTAKDGERPSMAEVPLSICYLSGVAAQLRQTYRDAQEVALAWCKERAGTGITSNGNAASLIRASAEFLCDASAGRLTTRMARVGVSLQKKFECEMLFHIEPADAEADRVLRIDEAIRRFLSGDGVEMDEQLLREALSRAWNLRLFKPLYQLRAGGDFTL